MPDEVTAWHSTVPGITAEDIGHITTKGWDKLTPGEAALNAVRAHREAEKFVGAPADQLIRLPKEPGAPEWKGVWQRLGAPAEAKDYDFTGVEKKGADGVVINAKFVDHMRATAAELNLPKDTASRFATAVDKYNADTATAAETDRQARVVTERQELAKNWGTTVEKINESPAMFIAKSAAAKLGVDPAAVTALEGQIGYKATMEMFHKIGTKIGEDKFVANPNGGTGGVMTQDQAVSKKAELMRDEAWKTRYMNGDLEARREMRALNVMIVGDDTAASRAA